MIKTALTSKAAKLLMACVCPVAGTTALTLGVPQVRQAVHNATAPRAYAKPKTRVRAPVSAPEEGVQVASADVPCPTIAPMALSDLPAVAQGALGTSSVPIVLANRRSNDIVTNPIPFTDTIQTPQGSPDPTPDDPTPAVPEPETWVQLVLGFAIIGGAARSASRAKREEKAEA